MDAQKPQAVDDQARAETPEDVAVLYSWANLQGARYRDFSGARRESRAQIRHRAAEEAEAAERRAQAEAEAAAERAERAARQAEEIARLHEQAGPGAAEFRASQEVVGEQASRAEAVRRANELSRKAASERIHAARRAEAAAAAAATLRREAREIANAKASAERHALRYAETEMRRRTLAGPQPVSKLPHAVSDRYLPELEEAGERMLRSLITPQEDMRPIRHRQNREARQILPPAGAVQDPPEAAIGFEIWQDLGAGREQVVVRQGITAGAEEISSVPSATTGSNPVYNPSGDNPRGSGTPELENPRNGGREPSIGAGMVIRDAGLPAWLAPESDCRSTEQAPAETLPTEDTLQQSRERVATRWFALRGLFRKVPEERAPELQVNHSGGVPVLAMFSLAGGVGKTSLAATLSRALCASGERVLLTDTTSQGLLPFYFGAREVKAGSVRTFAPPAGSADAPIHLLSLDLRDKGGAISAQEGLEKQLISQSQGMQRIVVDLSPSVSWAIRSLARMNTLFIVPMAADMSSVISLGAIESFLEEMLDANGRPIRPYFLLNGFDESQPLHLDIREVLRQQLADRLLPFVVRRSTSIPEALAEGMTVMDYAADAAVTADFLNLSSWIRTQAAPAPGLRKARWSEQ